MNENDLKQIYAKHDTDKEQIHKNILEKINTEKSPEKYLFRLKPTLAVCLSLFIVIIGCVSAFSINAEAKEYRKAVAFFDEYNIPKDGLSRSEIKSIYRDITTESFTYGKTGEILRQTIITLNAEGYQIDNYSLNTLYSPTELWHIISNSTWKNQSDDYTGHTANDIRYELTKSFSDTGNIKYAVISAYKNEQLIFSRSINGDINDDFAYHADDYIAVKDGVIICGSTGKVASSLLEDRTMIAKYNTQGKLLFVKTYDHGCNYYTLHVTATAENGALLILNEQDSHAMLQIDKNGNEVLFQTYEGRVNDCLEYKDGFLLTCSDSLGSFVTKLEYLGKDGAVIRTQNAQFRIRYLIENIQGGILITSDVQGITSLTMIDETGALCSGHTYNSDGHEYIISSAIEYEGKFWLSCVEIIPENGENPILSIFPDPYTDGFGELNEAQLKKLAKHIKVTLLVCGKEDYEPKVFYTIDGACLDKTDDVFAELWNFPDTDEQLFVTEDGYLAWTVGKISGGSYAPFSGRLPYQLYGMYYTYLFDKTGNFIRMYSDTEK